MNQVAMNQLKTHFTKKSFAYDGSQLRHLFAYEEFQILGNSLVSWVGPCNISTDKMVDGEDKFSGAEIRGDSMLHFIGEFFQPNIHFAVALQRLFASIACQELLDLNPKLFSSLIRDGDDLYFKENKLKKKKLSISIASISAFSSMFHFAVNVKNTGTPVETISLSELNIKPKQFSDQVSHTFSKEYTSMVEATQKIFFLS